MADPVADFLAREQDELAGLDDESSVPTSGADTPSVDGGLIGGAGGDAQLPAMGNDDFDVLGGGGDSGVDLSTLDSSPAVNQLSSAAPVYTSTIPKIEPEKIRKWRQDQKQRLEQKDVAEEKKMQDWRSQAKKELDDWYKSRRDQLEKASKSNRTSEREFIIERDAVEPGAEWERITKLCEFNPKNAKNAKDVSRLRSMLLQLKANEKGE